MKIPICLSKINNFILNILFPTKCIGCGKINEIFCDNCIQKIHLTDKEIDRDISAVFDYKDNVIKKSIWELKYHHKKYLGEKIGQLLYSNLLEDIYNLKISTDRAIYVIPVPISNKKKKQRGYNQSLSIAKGFCNYSESGIFELKDKIIYKKRETKPQAQILNRKNRLKNVQNVFDINDKDIIKGRTIIIIDDVTTTGATINEIIKILKKYGAKKVVGFAFAH